VNSTRALEGPSLLSQVLIIFQFDYPTDQLMPTTTVEVAESSTETSMETQEIPEEKPDLPLANGQELLEEVDKSGAEVAMATEGRDR